jgi:flagellum-specific ATP synthase
MLNLLAPLLDDLAKARIDLSPGRYGLLTACDGGLLEVSGLSAPVGALCKVAHGRDADLTAEVIGFRNGRTLMMLLGDTVMLRPGARVRVQGHPGMLPVGEQFLGRAVDGEGLPIDGLGPLHARQFWPAGGRRTGALDRSPVRALRCRGAGAQCPHHLRGRTAHRDHGEIGRGQVGPARHDRHRGRGRCGRRRPDRRARARGFGLCRAPHGGIEARPYRRGRRVPADHAPNLRLRGAMLATSLAEQFRAEGRQVLLIMDSLTRVAHAAREIALLLGEPGAARGYPPSALATITKLVERAGNSAASGGSITGVYTVLADGDNQDDPVVDTARSILDGHIVLSRDLAQRGQYPAIDIAASLSRVMADVAGAQHNALAREFRAMIASYEANRDLVLMGAYRPGADPVLDRAIAMHDQLVRFLSQPARSAVPLGESVAALAALIGHAG